ncbi:MAG TPA: hypothetical protein VGK40_00545 [Verrucomicrobiae bacterium]
MTFLPIVERELRVAARKRSTFWVRIIAALVALVIGSGFLILNLILSLGLGAASLGKGFFATLTWLSLAAGLAAGLFFTSDCLSEEKREGTIGLLFLTDLRGFDVVLGKLLATSLRGFYALLAVFPILAVTLLMGGVTGAQFWKTALALVNALFLSLVAGLFVSALSRDSQKALAGTLLLLVLLAGGGPAMDAAFAAIQQRGFSPVLSLSSPVHLLLTADAWGQSPFWTGLLVNQVVAWLLLGLTCWLLPRTWQEKAGKTSAAKGGWADWWKFGGAKRQAALRRDLIELNPAQWLACRERWQAVSLWVVSLLMAGGTAAVFANNNQSIGWWIWNSLGGALTLVLYLGVASQAGRFFVEAQRSGLMELLLATPLPARQIVLGQWRALLRMFGLPLAVCLAAQCLGAVMVQQRMWNSMASATPPTVTTVTTPTTSTGTTILLTNRMSVVTTTSAGGTVTVSVPGFSAPSVFVPLATSVAATLAVAANLAALSWFGMWMGMTSRTSNLATLKTILFVQIIPWFAISFTSTLAGPLLLLPRLMSGTATTPSQMMFWYPLITSGIATVLCLSKDVAFVVWARRNLYSNFRARAAEPLTPTRMTLPPSLPPADAPPVIAPT